MVIFAGKTQIETNLKAKHLKAFHFYLKQFFLEFRCTGYRPILDAFKSFADNVTDIEELKICKSTGKACPGMGSCGTISASCHGRAKVAEPFEWYTPTQVSELLDVLKGLPSNTKYRQVTNKLLYKFFLYYLVYYLLLL